MARTLRRADAADHPAGSPDGGVAGPPTTRRPPPSSPHRWAPEEYPSYEEHLAAIEAALRELAASGTPNLGIVTGTVPSYEAFAASELASPTDPALLPQYATILAARGRAVAWPPERPAACWCGSGRTYGECHGAE